MKKTLNDLNLKNKTVLVRVDFNVPMKNGVVTSNKRIVAALPTIKKVLSENAKVVLMSHLGRVKSEEDKAKYNLELVAKELSKLLGKEVTFVNATRGKELEDAIAKLPHGEVLLMQNTRYEDLNDKAESKNSPELGKYWASLCDVFVNDAFGTAHRAHASNVGVASNVKESCLGYLMEKEVSSLEKAVNSPAHPYVALIGGAKVSDKIEVLENLVKIADKMLIGGGMAYTFKKALGQSIGHSLLEADKLDFAKEFLAKYSDKVVLPIDNACSLEFSDIEPTFFEGDIPDNFDCLDIGPKTMKLFEDALVGAKTVVWNGPMGVTEFKHYKQGTLAMCKAISKLENCFSIVGGGDSVAAVEDLKMEDKFSHVSTGGGASLEFLQGLKLPGFEAIQEKN